MLDLQNLGSALSTVSPMGNYRLNLQAAQQVQVTLTTVEGALQLQGQGQWLAGRWRFQGQASTEPALEPALGNVLNIIGRREGARSNITIG
jgi:general secretion pathway protein N